MNNVVLIGRLTQDPKIYFGKEKVAKYSLAVPRDYKKSAGEKEVDFIDCVVFGKSVEYVEKYLKKGDKIAVKGSIRTGSYDNKNGEKVYTTTIEVEKHEALQNTPSTK